MKIKYAIVLLILTLFFLGQGLQAQSRDYRKDSLQFKMYTRLYVNDQLGVDSITVKKIFCDYCSEAQIKVLQNEAKGNQNQNDTTLDIKSQENIDWH